MPTDDAPRRSFPLGNSIPFALAGFSTAVFLVNSHAVGYVPGVDFVSSAAIVAGLGLLSGCVYQFLAGNNILVTNFGIYGSMWLSFGIHMLMSPTADFDDIIALIRIPILVYSLMALAASCYGSTAVFSLFMSLDISLFLEIIGQLQGGAAYPNTHLLLQVGGGFGVWCALSGFYMSMCILLQPYIEISMGPALLAIPAKPVGPPHGTGALRQSKKAHGSFGSTSSLLRKLRFHRRHHLDPEQGVHPQGPPDASHGALPPKAARVPAPAASDLPPPRADPRALGLSGFACIVVMYSAHYIGWVQRIDWISPLAMIAAIALLLSMIFHLNTGSTVHAANCGYYGAFFLAVSLNMLAQATTPGVDPITGNPDPSSAAEDGMPQGTASFAANMYGNLDGPLTWVRITCAIYTTYAFIASLFINRAYTLIYALFLLQLLLLIVGHLKATAGVMQAAGWVGLLCGILAWYLAASLYLVPFFEMPFWRVLSVPVLLARTDEKGNALPLRAWLPFSKAQHHHAHATSSMADLKAVLEESAEYGEEAAGGVERGSHLEVEMADHPQDAHQDMEQGPAASQHVASGDRPCPTAQRRPASSSGGTAHTRAASQAASYGGDAHGTPPLASWSVSLAALQRPFQRSPAHGGMSNGTGGDGPAAGASPRIALAQQAHYASVDLESAYRQPGSSTDGAGWGGEAGPPAAAAAAYTPPAATLQHAATAAVGEVYRRTKA